jgi:antitoxin FitA
MAQILVRDLDQETVDRLKERARLNRRSLEAEVRAILETAARRRLSVEEFFKIADEIARASGPQSTDSVDLIREDRER